MTERSAVSQLVQIGPESTPGTLVAATKKLGAFDFEAQPNTMFDPFRPNGYKFLTFDALTKEWMSLKLTGKMSFGDLIYPLSGLVRANSNPPSVTNDGTSSTSTGTYKWIFEPNPSSEDTPITYTIEQGSAVRAQKYGYGLFTGFGFDHTREKVDVSGDLIARVMTDGITLTGALPSVELIPATANMFDVYLDPTSGALGTTKLSRLLQGQFEFSGKWGPLWVIDTSQASFAAHVELAPTVNYKILVEADTQGMGLLATLRLGTTQFVRVKAVGPVAYTPAGSGTFSTTSGSAAITAASPTFSAADVGRAITSPNFPAGTTLIAQSGATGTASQNASATSSTTYALGTAVNYSATFDLAVKVAEVSAFKDEQGVYAIEFTLQVIYDPTWGKALHFEVVNKTTSL